MASSSTLNTLIKKKTRTQISLEVKLKIIRALESGSKINNAARLYNLNESTIRTIKKNADSIKLAVQEAMPMSSKVIKYARNTLMVKMEKLLIEWIIENNREHIGMDTRIIQTKALTIFNELKKECDEQDNDGEDVKRLTFVASKGWFDKFKKRYDLKNIKFDGEASMELKLNGHEVYREKECIEKEESREKKKNLQDRINDEADDFNCVNHINRFTTENIETSISMIQNAIEFIRSIDPDHERSSLICEGLNAQIAPYEQILKERQVGNETTRANFCKPATPVATRSRMTPVKVEYSSCESDIE